MKTLKNTSLVLLSLIALFLFWGCSAKNVSKNKSKSETVSMQESETKKSISRKVTAVADISNISSNIFKLNTMSEDEEIETETTTIKFHAVTDSCGKTLFIPSERTTTKTINNRKTKKWDRENANINSVKKSFRSSADLSIIDSTHTRKDSSSTISETKDTKSVVSASKTKGILVLIFAVLIAGVFFYAYLFK